MFLYSRKSIGLIPVLFCTACASYYSAYAQIPSYMRFDGWWTNLTFNSYGPVQSEFWVIPPNVVLKFNVQGPVFGTGGAAPVTITNSLQAGAVIQIDQKGLGIFGDMKGTVDLVNGTLSCTNVNIPNTYIRDAITTGTIQNGIVSIQYTIDFNDIPSLTNPAHGVMVARMTWPFEITRASQSGSSMILEWLGGKPPFAVQSSPDMNSWSDVVPSTQNTNATVVIGPSGGLFYRVKGQP